MSGGRQDRHRCRPLGCDEACEAVSARLDGERLTIADQKLEAHLASCPSCLAFEAQVAALRRQVSMRPARPVPEDLVPKLVQAAEVPSPPSLWAVLRYRAGGCSPNWAGAAQWAGATMSVVVVALALSFGVGHKPHLVPTRPPSTCTIGLAARHLPGRN
ncbi:MAG TPA: zf-HC2 domain-containing protein [Acidimicrobiales bacterium]|nr:zf-HC2 domain-containing protein [Acidimicrobiales bacterium]